ncbi:MAG: AraC family transcriptional regulator [Clostridia bacterium]|nr:AraC family transcriptional regulator [Clostridia bacterium]
MQSIIHSAYYSSGEMNRNFHYHDCHEIIFLLKGSIEICVNQAKTIAHAGQVVIFSRYENHSVSVLTDEYERYVMRISPFSDVNTIKAYSLFLNRPSGSGNIFDVSDCADDFRFVFSRIVDELENDNVMSPEMQQSLISLLMIMLYRKCNIEHVYVDDNKFNMIFEIQRRFETECRKQYTLDSLAREYHVSKSTLSHQFKMITGFSVFKYLNACRIASAKYFLTKTNHTVGEIVERCGFTDNSNFTQTFRKNVNMTPTEFRKKYKTG